MYCREDKGDGDKSDRVEVIQKFDPNRLLVLEESILDDLRDQLGLV
jgi:hypothetical protein